MGPCMTVTDIHPLLHQHVIIVAAWTAAVRFAPNCRSGHRSPWCCGSTHGSTCLALRNTVGNTRMVQGVLFSCGSFSFFASYYDTDNRKKSLKRSGQIDKAADMRISSQR